MRFFSIADRHRHRARARRSSTFPADASSRTLIAAYVEFIRNVPLILLVYLVFYGLPTVVDLAYDATTSFVVTLSVYCGRLPGRGVPLRS